VKRLISFPLECGGSVQLEVEEEAGPAVTRGLHPSDVVETIANSFEATLAAIKPAAIGVASIFRSIADAPESVEVEFGVKFAAQAGAFIACAGTEAQFRVKLVWQSKRAN
jgi:hypothetical protein